MKTDTIEPVFDVAEAMVKLLRGRSTIMRMSAIGMLPNHGKAPLRFTELDLRTAWDRMSDPAWSKKLAAYGQRNHKAEGVKCGRRPGSKKFLAPVGTQD